MKKKSKTTLGFLNKLFGKQKTHRAYTTGVINLTFLLLFLKKERAEAVKEVADAVDTLKKQARIGNNCL